MKINAVQKVLMITFFLNMIMAIGKLFYGYKYSLISMSSDGFHSIIDSSSNIVAIIAIYISQKPPDENYHYGYKKFEPFASLVISLLLFLTTYEVLKSLLERFVSNTIPESNLPSILFMILTIIVNYLTSKYENKKGHELKNKLLIDDSAHTSSDIFVSASVLISIIAAKYGLYFFDFISSGVIVIIITSLAWKILVESINILSDSSNLNPDDLEKVVLNVKGVNSCHKIRTRGMNDNIHVDLHIQVHPEMTITEAHKIGHNVQDKLREEIEGVKDVIIHVEPSRV